LGPGLDGLDTRNGFCDGLDVPAIARVNEEVVPRLGLGQGLAGSDEADALCLRLLLRRAAPGSRAGTKGEGDAVVRRPGGAEGGWAGRVEPLRAVSERK
jgi:hypothetical protein